MKADFHNETIRITECFSSIQGEGNYAGYPCFFIRLSGCNLRCRYCDTKYAWNEGHEVPIVRLVEQWNASRMPIVELTGGEPLLQPEVAGLFDYFLDRGVTCLLETNGSISLQAVPGQVVKIVDWKTPGSGHGDSFLLENLRFINVRDQIKFVIVSRDDYEWARDIVMRRSLYSICTVIFSSAYGLLDYRNLAEWIVEDALMVKFQLQLHRQLWGDRRGV